MSPYWPWRRLLLASSALTALAILAVAGGCGLADKERELVFRVEPGTARWYDGLPADVREIDLPVPQSLFTSKDAKRQTIHAWWWPAGKDAPAALYLHGSRWNLTGQLFRIRELHDLGFSVFAIDYRGFGRSEGDLPSERAVYEDARIGWNAMAALVPDPERRYIYGHSLGGTVAIDLAAKLSLEAKKEGKAVPAAGLVVESSFTNLADIARALSSEWLPIQLILTQKFDAIDKIADVRLPIVVVHGEADRTVPLALGRKLFEAAQEPKRLVVVANGTHNNSLRLGTDAVEAAFEQVFPVRFDGP
jgi:uncharacterized protein